MISLCIAMFIKRDLLGMRRFWELGNSSFNGVKFLTLMFTRRFVVSVDGAVVTTGVLVAPSVIDYLSNIYVCCNGRWYMLSHGSNGKNGLLDITIARNNIN